MIRKIKNSTGKWIMISVFSCFIPMAFAASPPLGFIPLTSTVIQSNTGGNTVVEYQVTNLMKSSHKFAMVPIPSVTQNTSSAGQCPSAFTLAPQASCVLSLSINRSNLNGINGGPQVCVTKSPTDNTPGTFLCGQPKASDVLTVVSLDPTFPYGATPKGNVCVSTDYYATPETMLGSWAMLEAVQMDASTGVLPTFLTPTNMVYGVGTAAIDQQLHLSYPDCTGVGCDELNGYCFALKFVGSPAPTYPYMIFQSVNTGALADSFDIYMAGGGSGAYPESCPPFWGTLSSVDWQSHIESTTVVAPYQDRCETYFQGYTAFNNNYSVSYKGVTHTALDTLKSACTFALTPEEGGTSGYNRANFQTIQVVAVTCPTSLTQITGIQLESSVTTIIGSSINGKPIPIINLASLTDNDFNTTPIPSITQNTQMQDCKTPSSGYCGKPNVQYSNPNYLASISAGVTAPLIDGPPSTYCSDKPATPSFCSWNNGQTQAGGSWCNANQSQCLGCGGGQWCTCNGNYASCVSNAMG